MMDPFHSRLRTAFGWLRGHYAAVFVGVFLTLLLLPLQGFSGSLADFPTSFWGYDTLVRLHTTLRYSILQDIIFDQALARPDGWLVYTGETSLNDFQNSDPFNSEQLALIQNSLDGLTDRLSAQGIRFMVVVVPGKNTIYPEEMPPEVQPFRSESRFDQVMEYMGQHGHTQVLDLRPALRAASEKNMVFYATETHWNPYGILAGYQAIIAALQPDFPSLQPHSLADFHVIEEGMGSGDISNKWLHGIDQEPLFQLVPNFSRQTVQIPLAQATAFLPGRMVATYTPDTRLPRAVIYHDSFFRDMIPFLADHFQWAIFHWTFQVNETFVAGEKPDVVIFEVTDRYLEHLLLPGKN